MQIVCRTYIMNAFRRTKLERKMKIATFDGFRLENDVRRKLREKKFLRVQKRLQ